MNVARNRPFREGRDTRAGEARSGRRPGQGWRKGAAYAKVPAHYPPFSRSTLHYDLVFEGGGAKGVVFVGAMQAFEAHGHSFGRLLGTSAGAMCACLLAAGYGTAEMLEALSEKKDGRSVFSSFIAPPAPVSDEELERGSLLALFRQTDIPFAPAYVEERVDKEMARWISSQHTLRHLYSFVERGGWYSADNFVVWLEKRLNSGSYQGAPRHFGKATLAEFYAATRTEVAFVAADITAGRLLVLNHRTAPDLPVVMAVRMSMSIPLLWQEVVWSPAWGHYRGKDLSGHAIVDGGILSNFPIELLVSRDSNITDLMGPEVSKRLLGFLIDEDLPVEGAEVTESQGPAYADLKTVNRLSNLLNTMLGARDMAVSDALERFVLRLPARGFGITEFDMSDDRRALLLRAGREAAEAYLNSAAAQESVSFDGEEVDRIPPKVRNSATKGALKVLGF